LTRKSGLGIRTTREFFKGEIIGEYTGELISTRTEYMAIKSRYEDCRFPSSYIYEFKWNGKSYWYAHEIYFFINNIFDAAIL